MTRQLAVAMLAPTVLVSFVLMGACAFGILYLNDLHVNVAKDLSENVQSTQVAARLEATTQRLIALLRGNKSNAKVFAQSVEDQNREAQSYLKEAKALVNHEKERKLVGQIQEGLTDYLREWEIGTHSRPEVRDSGAYLGLAERLEDNVFNPSRALRHFNLDQIEQSDFDNRVIVRQFQWGMLAVGVGLPLGGLVLGYAVARSLRQSISQLSVRVRDAAGRLNRDLGSVTLEEEGDLPDLHKQVQGITEEIERVVGELQQREREVLRAEQLAAVGQVAAGVAHELRNPLTSVKMLVQTGLEAGSPGLLPEDLAIIEHEIRRMEQCIRLFLDFARPPVSERRRTNLVEVVRRALALVEGRSRRQKIQVDAALPLSPVFLEIDPEQIHQVLVNLLLNALDALPHGGTIAISVNRMSARAEEGSTELLYRHPDCPPLVEVRIRDNGPGIAPRIRDRLFEPFVSSKETGIGLGLSICKRLIESNGGAIQGFNTPEGGAVFSFTLPVDSGSNVSEADMGGSLAEPADREDPAAVRN